MYELLHEWFIVYLVFVVAEAVPNLGAFSVHAGRSKWGVLPHSGEIFTMEEFKASQESQVRYLKRRVEEMTVLAQSSPLDFELAKKMGHQIKGNAESFGFSDLAAMGKLLDNAAEAGQADEVRKYVQNILTALQVHLKKNAAPL
ncbi:MAG: hypothetical protein ACKOX6_09755 [Bdellovibrio sp.]